MMGLLVISTICIYGCASSVSPSLELKSIPNSCLLEFMIFTFQELSVNWS
ncbi:hypothetical protein Leryth_018501 [Lithospermum erythrorhizon]|nr:hypothetical protein Leryth_018501 [Lithospermum erythrorhizon]